MNQLQALSQYTTIVADTGDIDSIAKIHPQDATTNPSLILKAAKNSAYKKLLLRAVQEGKDIEDAADRVLVNFGTEILKYVRGRVSTEVDARLSFDTDKTVEKARKLISLYKEAGVDPDRVLIKIAATWEGVQAAKILQAEGHSLQPDINFFSRAGRNSFPSRSHSNLTFCRPHIRLA